MKKRSKKQPGNARVKIVVWRSPRVGYFTRMDTFPSVPNWSSYADSDRFTRHERGLSVSLSAQVRLPVDASGLKPWGQPGTC
ncbi:MAG: hypothetical protein R2778_10005 [Saprospiraceae bacterium]